MLTTKNIAYIISFLLPGLGIAYLGNIKKGLTIFAIAVILRILKIWVLGMAGSVISFAVWAYGLYATYEEAQLL